MEKLNLDVLIHEQWQGHLLHEKVETLKMKWDGSFILDENGLLQKMVRLRYTIEPTIVVPWKLTCLITVEFHSGKGHQGVNHTVNMIKCYFWWHWHAKRCTPAHQELQVMYSFPT